jgi:glucosamine-6-phosphate deaminase
MKAITMGIDTILKAKKIIIMAFSETKADIVQKAVEGHVTSEVPASYL